MYDEFKKYFIQNPDAFYFNSEGKKLCCSVHGNSFSRLNKAQEQSKLSPVDVKVIIEHMKVLFINLGLTVINNPVMDPKDIDYSAIKKQYKLKDEKDIIWMKFTTDGYLGVVASSNDINFDIPQNCKDYDKTVKRYNIHKTTWVYNSSGIIIHKLNKKWDTSFVLVFPLHYESSKDCDRNALETAVGNYLIDKGVPILDFYSHNYHYNSNKQEAQ